MWDRWGLNISFVRVFQTFIHQVRELTQLYPYFVGKFDRAKWLKSYFLTDRCNLHFCWVKSKIIICRHKLPQSNLFM